uniref:Myb-like domain-containing protein n=1 Tax=Mucochytrium quahogii TaxID=96639 RepID=A0A7S2S1D2_9STRA|mmetsp:Transcript_15413/g.27117  ORF Transcript_15413/g.27117 Transcript_15413/m.27117 type:complete len:576 (+) Transcript_15413:144-1871(+)
MDADESMSDPKEIVLGSGGTEAEEKNSATEGGEDGEDGSSSGEEGSSSDEETDDEDPLSNLTEEQKKIIQERQDKLKAQYNKYVEKQADEHISELVSTTGVSREEAKVAIECCNNDVCEAATRIAGEPDFIIQLQEIIEEQRNAKNAVVDSGGNKISIQIDETGQLHRVKRSSSSRSSSSSKENSNKPKTGYRMDGEKRAESLKLKDALAQLAKVKRLKLEKLQKTSQKQKPSEQPESLQKSESTETPESSEKPVPSTESSRAGDEGPGAIEETKADPEKVDEASAKNKEQEVEVEYTESDLRALKWSDARIKAFLNRKTNPNAYYYRFNDLGEDQATGEWSPANKKRFMELIKDGVDYRWGIFSMNVPGRVGYQCSNYYRKLVQAGIVVDPNYVIDDKGKLTFKRPKGLKRGTAAAITTDESATNRMSITTTRTVKQPPRKKIKKKRKAGDDYVYAQEVDSDDGNDDSGTYGYGGARASTKAGSLTQKRVTVKEQLLPGMVCPMTFEPIHDPAISPYGHVMGYDTWMRVLGRAPRNTCPFTKQKLTRRSLIKLTKDNLANYQDKIQKVSTKVNV